MADVIEESPYAAVVDDAFLDTICSFCFKEQSLLPFPRCTRCKILHYCSGACQKEDWSIHKDECKLLVSFAEIPLSSVRLMTRVLIKKKRGDETNMKAFNGRTIAELKRQSKKKSRESFQTEYSSDMWILEKYAGEFMLEKDELCLYNGMISMNQREIYGAGNRLVGCGFYLGLTALHHSCAPSASIVFRGRIAVLRCINGATEYSNQLTVSYIDPESTTAERRKRLSQRFHFHCKCEACRDTKKDGFARSIKCDSCSDGLCLVTDKSTSLKCINCGTVSPVTVAEANGMNNRVLQTVEKMEDDIDEYENALPLYEKIYERSAMVLSKRNVPLALLAYRFTGDYNDLEQFDRSAKFAYSFHEAMRSHLPPASPSLTYYLMVAVYAVSKAEPSKREAHQLFKELKESVHLTHGTLESAREKEDQETIWLCDRIANFEEKFV